MLLNEKNKVIGITYATYDSEDSQNLNYAINVEYLQTLYKDLLNGRYELLGGSDTIILNERISSLSGRYSSSLDINNNAFLNYKFSSMQEFYDYTNPKKIFEDKLSSGFKEVYNKFNEDDKREIVEIYKEIESRTYTNNNPSKWEIIDYLINLKAVNKEESAVVIVDIQKNATSENVFNLINSYSLPIFNKIIILLTLGEYIPSDLVNEDAKHAVNTINDMNYTIPEKTTILEFLGYQVNGTNVNW